MIKTYVTFERRSADGKILEKRTQESRSWLKHFFDLWYPMLSTTSLPTIFDITGTGHTVGQSSNGSYCNLFVGSPAGGIMFSVPPDTGFSGGDHGYQIFGENVGIVLGTDNTVVTPQDNTLVEKIGHGETTGTLLHGGTEIYGLTFANPNGSMNIRRYFTNVSGGVIGIAESGIYSPAGMSDGTSRDGAIYCICRDVVSPAISVANGEILSVVYTVIITV